MMQIHQIPVSKIFALPSVDAMSLLDSVAEETTITEPLIVRQVGNMYQVIVGAKHWLQATVAGRPSVPAEIREMSDEEAHKLAILSRLNLQDLDFEAAAAQMPELSKALKDDMALSAAIEQSRLKIAEKTADQAPVFTLCERMPAEICDLFRNDFERDEVIDGVMNLTPKADIKTCNDDFDRFLTGLDAGELHLEGHLFGVNSYLITYVEAYLDDDTIQEAFPAGEWESLSENRQEEILKEARRIHAKVAELLFLDRL